MSWDIALSEAETGDYSACVVLLRRKEVFYILEVSSSSAQVVLMSKLRHGYATLES
jgi:phage terminase large subunit-like protein